MLMEKKVIFGEVPYTPEEAEYRGERLEILNDHFQKMLDDKIVLSGSYCLSRNNKVFADNALGNLSCEDGDNRPFKPDTIFGIASITKLFTAVAILKLVEDGKMRLDQPVCEFIEEFNSPPYNGIQIIHLLTHTSGLLTDGGAHEDKYYTGWWEYVTEENVNEQWITAVLKKGLRTQPGAEWSYSSVGYMLLGEIITRVSGVFCNDYIMENIVKPCEMFDTSFKLSDESRKRHNLRTASSVKHYNEYTKGEQPLKDDNWSKLPSTGGGLHSTCRDLVKFGQMILNNGMFNGKRIIGRKALEAMLRDQTDPSVKDWCWGAPGWHRKYGAGPDLISQYVNKSQIISDHVMAHEGYGTCCIMVDPSEQFVAVWASQYHEDEWHAQALRNVASIIWSGII